ncbi:MAG: hypothetical protein ABFC34_10755 [Methanobacterium sp.]
MIEEAYKKLFGLPTLSDEINNDGSEEFNKGMYENALLHYKAALQLDSKHIYALVNYCITLVKLNKIKEFEKCYNRLLKDIFPTLSSRTINNFFSYLLQSTQQIRDEKIRADALSKAVPYLPEHMISEYMSEINNIRNEKIRADALSKAVPHFPEHVISEYMREINHIQDENIRADALSKAVPLLPERMISEYVNEIRNINDIYLRAKLLIDVSSKLPDSEKRRILKEALHLLDSTNF